MSNEICPNIADDCFNQTAVTDRSRHTFILGDAACPSTMPASGDARIFTLTDDSLVVSKDTEEDASLEPTGRTTAIVENGSTLGGNIDQTFRAGGTDMFMEVALRNSFSTAMDFDTFKAVSWASSSTISVDGRDVVGYYTNGQTIRTSGFTDAANNGHFTVAGSALVGSDTIITVTTATSVAESSTQQTLVQDANDVVILGNTNIRAGTGGASTFDSNGTNAFLGLNLIAGQSIFVNGLGIETGDVTVTTPVAGDTVTIGDCTSTVVYEFISTGTIPTSGRVGVVIGVDDDASAAALALAIMTSAAAGDLNVTAVVDGVTTNQINLRNLNLVNGSIAVTGTLTFTAFAGGSTEEAGVFTVVSATDDVVTVTPAPGTDANAGALGVTVHSSVCVDPNVGEEEELDLGIETSMLDVNFHRIREGLRVATLDFQFPLRQQVTVSTALMGTNERAFTTTPTIVSPTYTIFDKVLTPPITTASNLGSTLIDGAKVVDYIQDFNISINTNAREITANVQKKFPVGINYGTLMIEGTLNTLFATTGFYNKFIDFTDTALQFQIGDQLGNQYVFRIPSVKLISNDVSPTGGRNTDIVSPIAFKAQADTVTGRMIFINRFSNVNAV